MLAEVNNGSFVYTALQLIPALASESDHSQAWTFERRDGYRIELFRRFDGEYRWNISFEVDGVRCDLDVHPENVLAVGVGPREFWEFVDEVTATGVDVNSSRTEGRAG